MKYVTAAVIVLLALGVFYFITRPATFGGGFSVGTITNTSSSIGMTDTLVNTPAQLQYFLIQNDGSGLAYCGFRTTSTLASAASAVDTGFKLNPTGSSTLVSFASTDNNLLAKYLHCTANTTTTASILKY